MDCDSKPIAVALRFLLVTSSLDVVHIRMFLPDHRTSFKLTFRKLAFNLFASPTPHSHLFLLHPYRRQWRTKIFPSTVELYPLIFNITSLVHLSHFIPTGANSEPRLSTPASSPRPVSASLLLLRTCSCTPDAVPMSQSLIILTLQAMLAEANDIAYSSPLPLPMAIEYALSTLKFLTLHHYLALVLLLSYHCSSLIPSLSF